MRRALASLFVLVVMTMANIAGAQQTLETPVFPVQDVRAVPTILTIDIDRLYAQSQFGERINQIYNQGGEDLLIENRRIADALRQEEIVLAEQRAEMDTQVFRREADAFDAKAQAIRRAQDAKESGLEETLVNGREQFMNVSRPILGQLMIDRGAFAILDRRSVFLSLGTIDVTDDAIALINDAIGDGAANGIPDDAGPAPQD